MSSELVVFFELIRLGLTPDAAFEMKGVAKPSVDWKKVVALAYRQQVYAIVFDGLKELYRRMQENATLKERYPAVETIYSKQCKPLKMEWMSKIMADEEYFEKQTAAVAALGKLWKGEGLNPILLKGLAYAEHYPQPKHRWSSDVDTFNYQGWETSNRLVEAQGIQVDRDYYKNSTFRYGDVLVENHQFCTPVRGDKRRKEYEQYLRTLLKDVCQPESGMASPPPMFNALYFMSHAHLHFLVEGGISLRHVCDWAMLMRAYAGSLDWKAFDCQCHRFGFDHFAWAMSHVASRLSGVQVPYECPKLVEEVKALIAEIVQPKCKPIDYSQSSLQVKRQVINSFIESRWKYRMFYDKSMWRVMLQYVLAFLFDREPKV